MYSSSQVFYCYRVRHALAVLALLFLRASPLNEVRSAIVRIVLSLLVAVTAIYSPESKSQSSCGFFDPKVRFADGSTACLSSFALLQRSGLITGEFANVVGVARTHGSSYALATTANPKQCPFVQFTSWNWSGQDASYALPGCEQRLKDALQRFPSASGCKCEVLLDSGKSALSRAEFEERLQHSEQFLATGTFATDREQALAKERERQAKEQEVARLKADETAKQLAELKRAEELRKAADDARQAQERLNQQRERERLAKLEDDERKRLTQEVQRLAEERSRFEREVAAREEKLARDEAERQKAALANLSDPSHFRSKVALVIGNAAYSGQWALKNPANDAKAIAERLKKLGFDVLLYVDLKVSQVGEVLALTHQRLKPGGAFVFYYAGHGVQLRNNENYFPTVDAAIRTHFDVPTQSLALQQILNLADESKSELRVVMLDACRNNPWLVVSRSISGGLAKVEAPKGTLISYATRPGSVAEDGTGQNGLYTGMLLKHMFTPNLPIESMFKRVARDVEEASRGQQEPWYEGNLRGEFAFVVNR